MHADELAVGNEQAHRGAIIHLHGGVAIIRPDAQKIAVANTGVGFDEFVPGMIAKAKRVEDVLPVAACKDKRFPMLLLPLKQTRLLTPPRIEVDVFDAADVVDGIHQHTAPERLALHIAD